MSCKMGTGSNFAAVAKLRACIHFALYYEWKGQSMGTENLLDLISNLTPEQQDAVRQFVDFLQRRGSTPPSRFLAAVDEFVDQHPELLRRLAQ